MDQCDKPGRRRVGIVIFNGLLDAHGAPGLVLQRDADVTEPAQVARDLLQFRARIGRFVQIGDDHFDELARQPYDALILGLNARPRLDDEPRNIDEKTERQYQREQHIDPGAQG